MSYIKPIQPRIRRHKKIRSRVSGSTMRPRLSVFRSNECIYAQIINDETHATIAAANDLKITKGTKVERAEMVGKTLAEQAQKNGITTVVFDRGGFRYTGRIKALADSARAAGLIF